MPSFFSTLMTFVATVWPLTSVPNTTEDPMSLSEYNPSDTLSFVRDLHHGSEAETCLVRSGRTGKVMVAKHIKRNEVLKTDGSSGTKYLYPNEAKILRDKLKSPAHANIIRLFGVAKSREPGRFMLNLEFCAGGDLTAQMNRFRRLTRREYGTYPAVKYEERWKTVLLNPPMTTVECLVPEIFLLHVFVSLVDALAYIHHGLRRNSHTGKYVADPEHRPVVHGDIKPNNILLRWPAQCQQSRAYGLPDVVLADFGCAQIASKSQGITGTSGFYSPEVKEVSDLMQTSRRTYAVQRDRQGVVTMKSDIYQLGHVMHILATCAFWPTGADPAALALPEGYATESCTGLGAAMAWCFAVDPKRRPSAQDLLPVAERFRESIQSLDLKHGALPQRVWRDR